MPNTYNLLISVLSEITRETNDSLIFCSACGNRDAYVKCGCYHRYSLNDKELTPIQRYRCDNDICPRKTFSILPHAFLPIIRASLCMLMYVLKMYEQGNSISEVARLTSSNWPRTQRWIKKASKIRRWIRREYVISPCLSANKSWTSFIREFSWFFYPHRF
jgi:transposase-like protein